LHWIWRVSEKRKSKWIGWNIPAPSPPRSEKNGKRLLMLLLDVLIQLPTLVRTHTETDQKMAFPIFVVAPWQVRQIESRHIDLCNIVQPNVLRPERYTGRYYYRARSTR
jgi:hypothetical protein